ncbi:MAG: hypothetical protein KGV59_01825 [Tenacibaculum sp.]|nr:hypothetical protein [Tenacibaculum sp.]
MKSYYKTKLPFYILSLFMLTTLVSCGTMQVVSDDDGIYGSEPTQRRVVVENNQNRSENYFTKELQRLDKINGTDIVKDVNKYKRNDFNYRNDEDVVNDDRYGVASSPRYNTPRNYYYNNNVYFNDYNDYYWGRSNYYNNYAYPFWNRPWRYSYNYGMGWYGGYSYYSNPWYLGYSYYDPYYYYYYYYPYGNWYGYNRYRDYWGYNNYYRNIKRGTNINRGVRGSASSSRRGYHNRGNRKSYSRSSRGRSYRRSNNSYSRSNSNRSTKSYNYSGSSNRSYRRSSSYNNTTSRSSGVSTGVRRTSRDYSKR